MHPTLRVHVQETCNLDTLNTGGVGGAPFLAACSRFLEPPSVSVDRDPI